MSVMLIDATVPALASVVPMSLRRTVHVPAVGVAANAGAIATLVPLNAAVGNELTAAMLAAVPTAVAAAVHRLAVLLSPTL